MNDLKDHLESIGQSKSQPAGSLARVADEGQAVEGVPAGPALAAELRGVLHHDHGEHPGVDEVLHPVADGVDGVEAGLEAGVDVPLVGAEVHAALGDGELEVGEGRAGLEAPAGGGQGCIRVRGAGVQGCRRRVRGAKYRRGWSDCHPWDFWHEFHVVELR